jgi:hypothetical protein
LAFNFAFAAVAAGLDQLQNKTGFYRAKIGFYSLKPKTQFSNGKKSGFFPALSCSLVECFSFIYLFIYFLLFPTSDNGLFQVPIVGSKKQQVAGCIMFFPLMC